MAESSGATKVQANLLVCKLFEPSDVWKQVERVELLKNRKQRLQGCKRTAVNLDLGTADVHTKSTDEKSPAQPPLPDKEEPKPSCSAASAAPVPSAGTGSEVSESTTAMEEEQCETEVTVDSAITPETHVETSEKEEESVSCSALQTENPVPSDGKEENLPKIDLLSFCVLKAAILQFKRTHNTTQNKEAQEHAEVLSSSAEPDANVNNSVTVDEMSEDMRDEGASTSKQTTGEKLEGQSSDVSSAKSSKTSPSSSMSTNVSVSTSSNSESNKPQTEPTSSFECSGTSLSSSSSQSVEALKAQSSSAGQTSPSSLTAAAAVRTSGQESDQKVSDKSSAAETVESKVETLSEVDPEQKVHQAQSLESKDEPVKEKDKEDKNTKETDNTKDPILDSLNTKRDEQINKEENQETQTPGPEKDQLRHQGGLLVLDGANKDETCSETKTDVSAKATDDSADAALNQEGTSLVKDEGSTVSPDQVTGSQTEDREAGKTDETISGPEESVPETPFRRSLRGSKNNQKTSQERIDEATIVTRYTRGRKKMAEKEDSDGRKESETPTRTKSPGRDGQEAVETEEKTPSSDVSLTENTGDTSESEQKISEDKEAATPRTRGRPRKTTRLTSVAVRKSIRGVKAEDTDRQEGVEEKDGCSEDDGTVPKKQRIELEEPEAKRSSLSPHFKLPPFNPETPLGKEFVSRKWGFFCNLCAVSYLNESTTEDQHCRSQTHTENLQRYKKKRRQLRQKLQPTRMSTRNSQKLLSD